MPRPSLAAKRKEEILDAFEQCILQDSLESTSLEKLADQANMKRSILRHYIGNRDDIIIALSERYARHYASLWQHTVDSLPEQNRLPALIEMLFDKRDQEYISMSVIADAVYGQAKRIVAVREHQLQAMQQAVNTLTDELRQAYPYASADHQRLVAKSILSNYLHSESLLPLMFHEEIEELKQASLLLLKIFE